MARSRFLGSRDPNAIVLRKILPRNNLQILSPFRSSEEERREEIHSLVIAGDNKLLRIFEDRSEVFERVGWRQGNPLFDSDTELWLFKKRRREDSQRIQLHVFEIWYELSKDFVVSNQTEFVLLREDEPGFLIYCNLSEIEETESRVILPSLEEARKKEILRHIN